MKLTKNWTRWRRYATTKLIQIRVILFFRSGNSLLDCNRFEFFYNQCANKNSDWSDILRWKNRNFLRFLLQLFMDSQLVCCFIVILHQKQMKSKESNYFPHYFRFPILKRENMQLKIISKTIEITNWTCICISVNFIKVKRSTRAHDWQVKNIFTNALKTVIK